LLVKPQQPLSSSESFGSTFWGHLTVLQAINIRFGLFAPRNLTVLIGLFIAALAVSGAIFLILEMYHPEAGLIQVSGAPLRAAQAQIGIP
jgi:membrane-bound ClpP family serine protease